MTIYQWQSMIENVNPHGSLRSPVRIEKGKNVLHCEQILQHRKGIQYIYTNIMY